MGTHRFHRVAVLKGGPSSEREVSLASGAAVARGLREAGYDVTEIDVTERRVDVPDGIEAVFIALHGAFGEDGGVQRCLHDQGIPYTGAGPEASRRAMDKRETRRVLAAAGIPVPRGEVLRDPSARTVPLPAVLKPPCEGSTIGICLVREESDWEAAWRDASRYADELVVEEYVPGRELTVGMVGDDALPVIEIEAPDGWYDYRAKYTAGTTRYHVPAPIPESDAARCRDLARQVFRALDGRGFGRVDFRWRDDGELFVLELNSIPGFTETSLLPKAAAERGWKFPELCSRIMDMACL